MSRYLKLIRRERSEKSELSSSGPAVEGQEAGTKASVRVVISPVSLFSQQSLELARKRAEENRRLPEAREQEAREQALRAEMAFERWPTLTQATRANVIPAVPCVLGRDAEGYAWECTDLALYARYAFQSFIAIYDEEEARAIFRMDLTERAVRRALENA